MTSRAEQFVADRGLRLRPRWRGIIEAWIDRCPRGQITVRLPDGNSLIHTGVDPGPSATIALHNFRPIWRMISRGEIGFAEAFMDDDWSTPDLTALIEFGLCNEHYIDAQLSGSWLARFFATIRFRFQNNSLAGARRNIAYHYDLGNDFYKHWLDETMTYSSALFGRRQMSLADAQRMKYRRVIEALEINSGDRVLEIGCGWGGFAEVAIAETGATITCLTISKAQEKFARARISADSLADKAEIRLEDYRDCRGTFDKVVSIEMFEAVGEENWPTYFGTLRERLLPGGQALLQLITVPDHRFEAYRRRVDFVQRHIFPGGMLPSPGALSKQIDDAGLKLREKFLFGASYAETLRRWNDRFQARWGDIRLLGFDERFRRMWTYYLQSCEACFRTGATDVGHYLVERPY